MEKFNLMDFIAKLGKAYLNEENKNSNDSNFNGNFTKGETKEVAKPSPIQPRKQSDSEKAIVEMLRRHDKKSREIDERNKQ